jgi:hypothetical protein
MPGKPIVRLRVSSTLEGFPAWTLAEYGRVTGEGERGALTYIIKRWTELDPAAKEHHLTLHDFNGEGEILPFRKSE